MTQPTSIPPLPDGSLNTPPTCGNWGARADGHLIPLDAQTAQVAGLAWAPDQPAAGAVADAADAEGT